MFFGAFKSSAIDADARFQLSEILSERWREFSPCLAVHKRYWNSVLKTGSGRNLSQLSFLTTYSLHTQQSTTGTEKHQAEIFCQRGQQFYEGPIEWVSFWKCVSLCTWKRIQVWAASRPRSESDKRKFSNISAKNKMLKTEWGCQGKNLQERACALSMNDQWSLLTGFLPVSCICVQLKKAGRWRKWRMLLVLWQWLIIFMMKPFSTRTPHLLRRLVSMKQYPTSFIAPKSLSAMVCSSAEAYWCRCHKLLSVFQILFWWLSYYQNQNNRRSWYWEAAMITLLRRRASQHN